MIYLILWLCDSKINKQVIELQLQYKQLIQIFYL